jgi:hypothetical protein
MSSEYIYISSHIYKALFEIVFAYWRRALDNELHLDKEFVSESKAHSVASLKAAFHI